MTIVIPCHGLMPPSAGWCRKGVLGGGVLATADCRKTSEELKARGVEFLQPPTERPYGIAPRSGVLPQDDHVGHFGIGGNASRAARKAPQSHESFPMPGPISSPV
jgi:hypothetical protein